jgi:HK97 family phage prohead protease
MPTSELALEKFTPDSQVGDLTVSQLRAAIASATRGKTLDGVRAQIASRAGSLKRAGWLPDNWNADGSLKSTAAAWATDEQRETWSDLYAGLQAALDEKFEDEGSYFYIWVQDFTATDVIFCMGGDLFSAPYSVDPAGPITVGDQIKVRPATTYIPTEPSERNASGTLEFRKRKADALKGTIEHREFEVAGLECRALEDGTLRMSGYGSVTEREYSVGPFVEVIRRGAFRRTLAEDPDVVLLYGHEGMPLARTKAGSLTLEENSKGLLWTADLDPEDPESRILARKVERGLIDQCSFAFLVTDQDWTDDHSHRSIKSVSLHRGDVSLVSMGANEATSVSVQRADLVGALMEVRAGKAISASNMDVLKRVLDYVATADDAVDAAQPLLADLMGVPNPDDDEPVEAVRSVEPLPDFTRRARQRLALLEGRGR